MLKQKVTQWTLKAKTCKTAAKSSKPDAKMSKMQTKS